MGSCFWCVLYLGVPRAHSLAFGLTNGVFRSSLVWLVQGRCPAHCAILLTLEKLALSLLCLVPDLMCGAAVPLSHIWAPGPGFFVPCQLETAWDQQDLPVKMSLLLAYFLCRYSSEASASAVLGSPAYARDLNFTFRLFPVLRISCLYARESCVGSVVKWELSSVQGAEVQDQAQFSCLPTGTLSTAPQKSFSADNKTDIKCIVGFRFPALAQYLRALNLL